VIDFTASKKMILPHNYRYENLICSDAHYHIMVITKN